MQGLCDIFVDFFVTDNIMSKILPFSGTATALVTPFSDGKIDFERLGALIELQIQCGIRALVIGGTTGEAATLSDAEREALYRFSIDASGGRATVILGTGTNDTRLAISHTRLAERLGADAVLTVTPYYNKGTPRGIVEHYRAIAAATSLPVILYNVPSRTGVNLTLEILYELAKVENIVAIKEASDSLDRLVALSASFGDSLYLYSGNDSQYYPTLALGGKGIISVASNLVPRQMNAIYHAFSEGNAPLAKARADALLPLFHVLFLETNPSPVKYALHRLGLCENEVRLPLGCVTDPVAAEIERTMRAQGLL